MNDNSKTDDTVRFLIIQARKREEERQRAFEMLKQELLTAAGGHGLLLIGGLDKTRLNIAVA